MAIAVPALVVPSAGAAFEKKTISRQDVGEHDILIDIAYAGICHSDIHQAREEWGKAIFPMVPGHEVAGIVSQVGSGVTKFAVGDRVGVGCFVDSCRECEFCLSGDDHLCSKGTVATYNGRYPDGEPTYGGYSTQMVVDENYALRIPENIPLDQAAPLLCAGITTYSPLKAWGAGPGVRVAVVGMGGLGHMAVKIAHALGADVTVLSQTLSKREDGLALGANAYFATSDPETFKQNRNAFDLIINTVSADHDVNAFLSLLAPRGAMVYVGLPENPQSLRINALIGGARRLAGSNIGSIKETQEMLDFCGEHGIGATIELIDADQVDEAYNRVVGSDVRYRFVIDTATIPAS